MATRILSIILILGITSCKQSQNPNQASLQKSIEIDTKTLSAEYLVEMAKTSNKLLDYESAIKYLSEAIEKDSLLAEAYFERGKAWVSKDSEKSISDFKKCALLNFRTDDCYYNIGVNFLGKNDSLSGFYINKALELNPNHKEAKALRGMFFDTQTSKGSKM